MSTCLLVPFYPFGTHLVIVRCQVILKAFNLPDIGFLTFSSRLFNFLVFK